MDYSIIFSKAVKYLVTYYTREKYIVYKKDPIFLEELRGI